DWSSDVCSSDLYTNSGFFYAPSLGIFGSAGRFVADGNGGLTGSDSLSIDGGITRGRKYTGTYTVNADCTGSMIFQANSAGGNNFDIVLTDNGRQVKLVEPVLARIMAGAAQQRLRPKP